MIDVTGLIGAAMPAILALIQQRHAAANPGAPPLTDEQVFAALHDWAVTSVARDDEIAADVRKRNPDA